MQKEIISTDKAPGAIGPYSQAVKVDNVVYISGQIPIDPATGEVVAGGVQAEARTVLENLKAILESSGSSFERVVKVTVYITDMNQFAQVNEVYAEYFTTDCPARACVEVSALPKGVAVEMDAVALCA